VRQYDYFNNFILNSVKAHTSLTEVSLFVKPNELTEKWIQQQGLSLCSVKVVKLSVPNYRRDVNFTF
jgi:hypothetical protein